MKQSSLIPSNCGKAIVLLLCVGWTIDSSAQTEQRAASHMSMDALPSLCNYNSALELTQKFAAMPEVVLCKLDVQTRTYELKSSSKEVFQQFEATKTVLEKGCEGKKVVLTPAMQLGLTEAEFQTGYAQLRAKYGDDTCKQHLEELRKK